MTAPLPVIITPNAANDLTEAWVWLRERNPRAADEWLAGIRGTILGLGAMWCRCFTCATVVAVIGAPDRLEHPSQGE